MKYAHINLCIINVDSKNFKLLYERYHNHNMQEGDKITDRKIYMKL